MSARLASPRPASPGSTTQLASDVRFAVMRLSRRLRQHNPPEITQSQLSALAVLVREGRQTVRQLAEAERIQPPTVTRMVDALVDRGLVGREPDTRDRRVTWIVPTGAGRAVVETVRRRRDAYLARRLRDLSPSERDALVRALPVLERLIEDPER